MNEVLLMIIVFLVLVVLDIPIAFSMATATILALLVGGTMPIQIVHQKMISGIESFSLSGDPLVYSNRQYNSVRGQNRQHCVSKVRGDPMTSKADIHRTCSHDQRSV